MALLGREFCRKRAPCLDQHNTPSFAAGWLLRGLGCLRGKSTVPRSTPPASSIVTCSSGFASAFSIWTEFTVSTGKRVNFREECHWSHACKSFKRTRVGSNGILECNFLSENAHRTNRAAVVQPADPPPMISTFSVVWRHQCGDRVHG